MPIARSMEEYHLGALQLAPQAAAKADSRIPGLDGLRGIASLMVVAYHFGPHIVRESNSKFAFLHLVPPLWFEGVDLFFVLSGFLISGILVDARESTRYFTTFYARRIFRIFPLYYLVLLGYGLALILGYADTKTRLFENPLPFWLYIFYLQNFAMGTPTSSSFGAIWMAGSWSLAVEEQFYMTLPAIIRRVGDRGLLKLSLLALAFAPLLRALIQKFKFLPGIANYVLLPTRVDSLAVGVLVMLAVRYRPAWLAAHRNWIAWATLGLFSIWSAYPYIPNPQAIRLGFINYSINALVFGFIVLSLLMFPLSVAGRLLSTRPVRSLGNMAYSTYLFHPILLCLAFRALRVEDPRLNEPLDLVPLAFAGILTFGLSWLSWSQFESRMLRIGHRFRY